MLALHTYSTLAWLLQKYTTKPLEKISAYVKLENKDLNAKKNNSNTKQVSWFKFENSNQSTDLKTEQK